METNINDDQVRLLWLAVIRQAIMDACDPYIDVSGLKPKEQYDNVKTQTIAVAEGWLSGKFKNFETVCSLASVSPSVVRKAGRDIIKYFREYGDYPALFKSHLTSDLFGPTGEESPSEDGDEERSWYGEVRR